MFQFTGFPLHDYTKLSLRFHHTVAGVFPAGFPHSETRGSTDICSSPRLFAACRVFLRLLVPGHPPCALYSLTCRTASKSSSWRSRAASRACPRTAGRCGSKGRQSQMLLLRSFSGPFGIALPSGSGRSFFLLAFSLILSYQPRMSLFSYLVFFQTRSILEILFNVQFSRYSRDHGDRI